MGTKDEGGDPFSQRIAAVLAKRAGYICSICGAGTVGPSETNPAKAKSVGVAAHITASRPGGPRYDARLSSEQRRSPENGIWLCQTCSRLIDANGGKDHPAEMLLKRKSKHESEISRSLGKAKGEDYSELAGRIDATGIGDVTGANIQAPTRIKPGTYVSASGIGRVTGVRIGGK
jgi:hypothetical protein